MDVHQKASGASRRTMLVLACILLIALAIRLLPIAFSIVNGHVIFAEYDPYYHMRRIVYSVEHFPGVNAFDSYVGYPAGYSVGWPPLFDLLGAGLSLVAGLGHPDRSTIELVSAMLPVILGVLSIIPLFYIVKDAMGKNAALIVALVMAILPGSVFRTIFGFVDHHALEVFLSLTTYLLFMRAVSSARAGGMSLSNAKSQRTPLIYAALAGVGIASMVFAWDGAPVFVGIMVAYAFIQFAVDSLDRERAQYLAIVGAIASLVAVVIVLPFILLSPAGQHFEVSLIYLSWFQVIYLFGMLAFFVVVGLLTDTLLERKAPWYAAPGIVVAIGVATIVALKLALPAVFTEIGQGLGFITGGTSMASNISEMQPLFSSANGVWYAVPWAYFSMAGPLAIVGLVVFLFMMMRGEKLKDIEIFFLVWTAVILVLALLQKRFIYLLAVSVSIYAGYLLYEALSLAGLDRLLNPPAPTGRKKASKSKSAMITPSLVGILIIAIVLLAPVFLATAEIATIQDINAHNWNEACAWVDSNTPPTSYTYTADEGTHPEYGIMSWWDYGNYILYKAERPAISNNFQTGIDSASHFFIAQDEAVANKIIDSTNARYVMVDNRMGSAYAGVSAGIFENMPSLAGDDPASYHMTFRMPQPFGITASYDGSGKYYGTMYSRLYNDDGLGGRNKLGNVTNGLEHYRFIYATNGMPEVKVFEYVKGAHITGKAAPGAKVELTLNVTLPDGEKTYYSMTRADQHGSYMFTVPYPTSDASEPVKTGAAYTIRSGAVSVATQVPDDAVANGATITAGDL